jgi:hypothetical protein
LIRPLAVWLAWLAGLATVVSFPSEARVDGPTAEAILDRMWAAYSSLPTYVDVGVQRTVLISGDGKRTITERHFKTAFRRPGRFRLEYSVQKDGRDWNHCIIWAQEGLVRDWCARQQEVRSAPTLGWEMGSFAGVSERLSMRVPGMLMPDQLPQASAAGGKPIVYTGATRLADEPVAGSPCFSLQMETNGHPSRMWIEQSTYLIRRVTSSHEFSDFRTEEMTDYDPQVGRAVPDRLLEFGAPPAGGPPKR